MNWWVASLLANVAVMFIEYVNRGATGGWLTVLPYTIVPLIAAQWLLFLSFNGAPSWLIAWAVFTVGNCVMRLTIVGLLPAEAPTNWTYTLVGCALMLSGTWILRQGLPQ